MSLLAVDIGSSACKVVAFAAEGEILAEHSTGFTPEFPQPGFAEMSPNKFWDALCTSCRAVAHDLDGRHLGDPVQALCLSSHGETFVAVDAHGKPLRNAILNQDSRALRESVRCEELVGRERLFRITGHQTHPMYPIPKILWLRENEPDIFSSTGAFLTLIGFLLQKMGLPPYVDYSLASRFLAFDITRRAWSDEILSAVDLQKSRLPEPVAAGTIAGKLNSEIASELGLPRGIPIVLGGHDQPCNALGSGITSGGRVSDSIGTYECLLAASDAPSLNDTALRSSLNTYCHVVPGKYVTLAYFPSGIMVKWFHDLLYANGSGAASLDSASHHHESGHYEFLEAHSPAGPTGLCITPHLIGTCNPEFNPRARGFIGGLNPGTDRAHIYKGILEGLACELRVVSEGLAEAVGGFDDIYVTGGGTRSALGLRLRAALTGRRVHVMKQQEAVCLGTAILAWVAIGEYSSIDQAVAALVDEDRVVEPDSAIADSYRTLCTQYRKLRSVAVQA